MLLAFGHRVATCCDVLGVVGSNLAIFKLEPTTPNTSQHIATRWPNASNMLRPTMLRHVALACCDRLTGALSITTANNWARIYFGRSLTLSIFFAHWLCMNYIIAMLLLVIYVSCMSTRTKTFCILSGVVQGQHPKYQTKHSTKNFAKFPNHFSRLTMITTIKLLGFLLGAGESKVQWQHVQTN